MNKCILFANIGTSDIGKNNEPLFRKDGKQNVYEESKKLYESPDFRDLVKDLELIILWPTISKIKENNAIQNIFLFATEQLPYDRQDTKYCAEIVKKLLCYKHNFSEEKVRIFLISENPSDYDEMFQYYKEKIEKIKKTVINENNYVYVSLTGGTPAQTTALLLWLVLNFGNRTMPIYKPGRGGGQVKEMKIGLNIYKLLLDEQLEAFESKKFYVPLVELAKKFDLRSKYETMILEAKARRDMFDFEEEMKILRECSKLLLLPEEKRKIEKRIEEIKILTEEKDKKALIIELYENMKTRWEQGAYADFVARLFRFEEAVYHYLISKEFGIDVSIKNNHEKFLENLKHNEDLSNFIKEKRYGGKPIELKAPLSKPLMFFVLLYYKKKFGMITEIFNTINDYEGNPDKSLGELRNKSILAHGFEGVSKEKIIELYGKKDTEALIKDIEKIVNFIKSS